jgi:hypothetical protein
MVSARCRLAQRLLNAYLRDKKIADNSQKAIFLELRPEQLAVGHPLRCHSDFHLFDAKKLV